MATRTKKPSFDRVFHWERDKRKNLQGKRCRVLGYGSTQHSVLVEFEDGERVITSARAVRG